MLKSHNRKVAMEAHIFLLYFTLMLECLGFVSCIVRLWKKRFCTIVIIIIIITTNSNNKTKFNGELLLH